VVSLERTISALCRTREGERKRRTNKAKRKKLSCRINLTLQKGERKEVVIKRGKLKTKKNRTDINIFKILGYKKNPRIGGIASSESNRSMEK